MGEERRGWDTRGASGGGTSRIRVPVRQRIGQEAPVETDTALAGKCSSKLTRGWPVWRRRISVSWGLMG